ncbi:MAG: hypothetical protein KHX49_07780 [Lachnospiraceae bacterium]|nr:hypothetical protein [Lachnospiraceae bacterium]
MTGVEIFQFHKWKAAFFGAALFTAVNLTAVPAFGADAWAVVKKLTGRLPSSGLCQQSVAD